MHLTPTPFFTLGLAAVHWQERCSARRKGHPSSVSRRAAILAGLYLACRASR